MRSPSCPGPASDTDPFATARRSPTTRPKRSSAATPSTSAALTPSGWTTKINLIDTPGYLDFQGDAIAGLAAADGALCVVSATAGVEVGTEKMFREAVDRERSGAVRRDDDGQGARRTSTRIYQQIKTRLTSKVIPVEMPIGEGPRLPRHHQPVREEGATCTSTGRRRGEYEETDIPPEEQAAFDHYYQELIEAISATDDTLLERYLEGGEIGRDEAIQGMKEAMKRMDLFPLFCVSADSMTTACARCSPRSCSSCHRRTRWRRFTPSRAPKATQTVEIHANDDGPVRGAGLQDARASRTSVTCRFFRIFSGMVANGQEVYNATRDGAEKLNHLSIAQGKERIEVPALHAGDIGCVAKLRNTHTNDTLSTRTIRCGCRRSTFPSRSSRSRSTRHARRDEEKLQAGLHRLHDEDPTLRDALQRRDARDAHLRHGRAASRGGDGEAQAEVRRAARS